MLVKSPPLAGYLGQYIRTKDDVNIIIVVVNAMAARFLCHLLAFLSNIHPSIIAQSRLLPALTSLPIAVQAMFAMSTQDPRIFTTLCIEGPKRRVCWTDLLKVSYCHLPLPFAREVTHVRTCARICASHAADVET